MHVSQNERREIGLSEVGVCLFVETSLIRQSAVRVDKCSQVIWSYLELVSAFIDRCHLDVISKKCNNNAEKRINVLTRANKIKYQ